MRTVSGAEDAVERDVLRRAVAGLADDEGCSTPSSPTTTTWSPFTSLRVVEDRLARGRVDVTVDRRVPSRRSRPSWHQAVSRTPSARPSRVRRLADLLYRGIDADRGDFESDRLPGARGGAASPSRRLYRGAGVPGVTAVGATEPGAAADTPLLSGAAMWQRGTGEQAGRAQGALPTRAARLLAIYRIMSI